MKNLWIDTDCGVDDSMAILIALNCPGVNVVGISCVGGNVSLDNVERNVLRTLSVYGRADIPVYRGCARGLLAEPNHIPDIHGSDGLGDIDFDSYGVPLRASTAPQNAVAALIDTLMARDDVDLLTLGPLTNIAHAIHIEPRIVPRIRSVVVMGGAEDLRGNTTEFAEFNFMSDPEAAAMVFRYVPQQKITMVSWTLTCKYVIEGDLLRELFCSRSTVMERWLCDTWKPAIRFNVDKALTADPLAALVACYGDRAVRAESRAHVDIVLAGERVAASVPTPDENGTTIIDEVDFDFYVKVLRELLRYK